MPATAWQPPFVTKSALARIHAPSSLIGSAVAPGLRGCSAESGDVDLAPLHALQPAVDLRVDRLAPREADEALQECGRVVSGLRPSSAEHAAGALDLLLGVLPPL